MIGWVIKVVYDNEYGRDSYWVLTAYMQGVEMNEIFVDPVYMLRKGYKDIKWIGMDALGAWASLEQAECYIEELGGTRKIGNGYTTEVNYEYIFSVKGV